VGGFSWFSREFPRVLAALGPAVAVVGITVYAMATAYREPRDSDITISVVLMVVGAVLFAAGLLFMRMGLGTPAEPPEEPAAPGAEASGTGYRH
jgi:hypothetical protein